jgi:integration host factor subunit beta
VTKKEIVKQIADRIGLTQLKTKEIVQQTFNAIVETLMTEGRIELRNFGVFEVKERKPRKARNPRTGEKVDVPSKFVVTFKPGKEMEEKVRQLQAAGDAKKHATARDEDEADHLDGEDENGLDGHDVPVGAAKSGRSSKVS